MADYKEIQKSTKIYIAGHRGMVGSAVWRALKLKVILICLVKLVRTRLRNQQAVDEFYDLEKPEVVIDAAAKVGGILANNDYPYPFLMENMQIQNNLIDGAFKSGIEKIYIFGQFLHLPQVCSSASKRRVFTNGFLRAH